MFKKKVVFLSLTIIESTGFKYTKDPIRVKYTERLCLASRDARRVLLSS